MARNRVIYQSEALYVSENAGSTGQNGHEQLTRIQSANYNFTINRQDVNEFGQLARIDSIVMDAPTVGLDFTYYPTDGFNEAALGFGTGAAVQFASGHLVSTSGKNFYISTVADGSDAVDTSGNSIKSVIGLGNAFLTDYTLDLSVGSLPTVSVSMECSNINSSIDTSISGLGSPISGITLPSVDITDGTVIGGTAQLPIANPSGESDLISALRPGDIAVDISTLNGLAISNISGADVDDSIHIQSASLSLPLGRSPIQRLGTRFAYARTVDFPVNATLSVNAILNEVNARNLSELMDNTQEFNVSLLLKNTESQDALKYELKGCKIDSESFSSSIGSNKTVDLTFSTQIGGNNDTDNGVFLTASKIGAVPFTGS